MAGPTLEGAFDTMTDNMAKPVLFSGIQPSGNLTIANYIGALRSWVKLQEQYDCLFALVDLHSLTVPQEPRQLRERCYDFLALYVACGVDPAKSTVFVQSHVPTHAELAWVLGCFTYVGELSRMTQFKEKSRKRGRTASAGLFSYPLLMAADILLYQTDLVPVGEDQKQHVELTRDVAARFNALYGETFRIPQVYLPPVGARIKSLQDPTRKMDKSDQNEWNYIALLDPPDVVRAKVRRAVTDSGTEVTYDESRPAIANLMTAYGSLTGESFEAIAARYAGKGYAAFKADLAEVVIGTLRPIQSEYTRIRGDAAVLRDLLANGAGRALARSRRTMDHVYDRLGLVPAAWSGVARMA
jgi:tryptophanyl-tRNA synthetase